MSLASSLLASFVGKNYTNLRRVRARTPNASHSFRILVLLAKASHPPFIAARDLTRGQPVIYSGSTRGCNNADSPYSTVPCERIVKRYTSQVLFLRIFRVQSVWHIQSNHFYGILPEKEVFSDIGSD